MGWGLLVKEGRVRGNGNGSICLSWGRGAAEIVVIAHFPTAAIFTRGNKTHSALIQFLYDGNLGAEVCLSENDEIVWIAWLGLA